MIDRWVISAKWLFIIYASNVSQTFKQINAIPIISHWSYNWCMCEKVNVERKKNLKYFRF